MGLQQFSKHNDGVVYILTVIGIVSKHAWTIFLRGVELLVKLRFYI